MGADCWVCGGRGGAQVVLRPDGAADGRRVCRVCTRRLLGWLAGLPADGRAESAGAVWPGALLPELTPAEPDEAATRAAFLESVGASLPGADSPARLAVALGYWDLGLRLRALEVLGGVDPAWADAATDRSLTSLLSRLLHASELGPQSRERLEAALYPEPVRP